MDFAENGTKFGDDGAKDAFFALRSMMLDF